MGRDIPRIRAVCFDVDGTLSDTDDRWVQAAARMLRPLGARRAQRLARRLVMGLETPGNWVYGALDRLHLDDEILRTMHFVQRWGKDRSGRFTLVPGVYGMLTRIGRQMPLAVVSARGEQATLAFLEQFNLRGNFRAVATALTCAYTKPFPDPLLWAAAQMGVAPQDCLMVGDTTVDIRTGKAAGAQTVGVLCGFGGENELRRAGAGLILESTAELAAALGIQ
ncbi:MAG: HAD family hydrolase [Chloroflexota bacterium]